MDKITDTIEGLMHIQCGDPMFRSDEIFSNAIELLEYMPRMLETAEIQKVKQGLRCCTGLGCHHGCEYNGNPIECGVRLRKDALSVIEWLSSNEGAIHVLRNSHGMQKHDHEMSIDGTLFVKWLSELMLNTEDDPIKPSEIINRIEEGGFLRFVEDMNGMVGDPG